MLRLNLPEIDEFAEPAFADTAACAHWISQFQLTDIRLAHHTLSRKLWEMNRSALSPIDRLKITEQLRDTVSIVQSGYARKIIGKPLPFNEIESAVLGEIVSLWSAMAASYGHCLKAGMNGDEGMARHLALICQRCLRYTALQIVEYLLMRHQVEAGLWHLLHQLYLYSEENGFSTLPVLESLRLYPKPTSCADHFIRTVLICQADPYELTRKQFQLVNRWLDEWVSWVSIVRDLPPMAKESPPISVDLDSSECICETSSGPAIRHLDITELAKNLRVKTALLQQGQSPLQLGLGDEFPEDFCLALIGKLHKNWCEGKRARMFEKSSISHQAEVCFGLPAVHFRIGGSAADHEPGLSFRQHEEISLFGHVATRPEQKSRFDAESWDVQDENARGFVLAKADPGHRVSPGHLVGIGTDGRFAPCVIQWAIASLDGRSVNMGTRLLEGRPEAVSIRSTGINPGSSGKYAQAILLHLGEWSSLIMPKGWYSLNRIIEIRDDEGLTMEFRLVDLVGKGADYERATFTQL